MASGGINKPIAPMTVFCEKEAAHRKQNGATASSKVSNFSQFRAYIHENNIRVTKGKRLVSDYC